MADNRYMKPRATRREARTLTGRFRGGKLAPIMATPFRESESGVVSQQVHYKLDPIPGRMITPITAEVIAVYVPLQAIDALKNPSDAYPGNAEVLRQKLLAGTAVFGTEAEGEISKRCGVEPRSVSGTKVVNEAVRIGHNVAVNYLRQRKYVNATLLDATNTDVTEALIDKSALDRLNGVLDPEDRVNGAVNLQIPDMPVKGIGGDSVGSTPTSQSNQKMSDGTQETYTGWNVEGSGNSLATGEIMLSVEEDPNNAGYPYIRAVMPTAGPDVSLSDFYTAEKMDGLTRAMRKLVDENPQHGEELVTRWAHGLSIDIGKQPFELYRKQVIFGMAMKNAMDFANIDEVRSNLTAVIDFTVPVPPTEFGGIVYTFACVKPDEVMDHQPHPILSEEWGATNYVADEMATIDPEAVTVRDLYADCATPDEGNVMMYVGKNHLKKTYVNYGLNRHLDPLTVEDETSVWQIQVPLSVTPENILYPTSLDHSPFADTLAEVCTYTVQNMARINTPIIFGSTPVEELAQIETDDIFQDAAV
jgi:hypothetical protein